MAIRINLIDHQRKFRTEHSYFGRLFSRGRGKFANIHPLTDTVSGDQANKLNLACLANLVDGNQTGVNVSTFNIVGKNQTGINIAWGPLGGATVGTVTGAVVGLFSGGFIGIIPGCIVGAKFGSYLGSYLGFNLVSGDQKGITVAPTLNAVLGDQAGLTIAGIVNYVEGTAKGISLAVYSRVGKLAGITIGLINIVDNSRESRGLQLGILNIRKDSWLFVFPGFAFSLGLGNKPVSREPEGSEEVT